MVKKISLFMLVLAAAASSRAQERNENADSIAVAINKSSTLADNKHKSFTPFGTGALSNFFSNLNLSSTYKEGVNGKIELAKQFSDRTSGNFYVDQKIGKNDEEATPIDLSGISPGTTAGFGFQGMLPWHPERHVRKMTNKEVSLLDVIADRQAQRRNRAPAKDTCSCWDTLHINGSLAYRVHHQPRQIDPRTLDVQKIYQHADSIEKIMLRPYLKAIARSTPWYYSLKASITKTSFTYATDSATLKQIKEGYITPTLSAAIVKTLGNPFRLTGYVALKYTYSESYKAADDLSFTLPFGTTGNFYSKTMAFGKPKKKTTNNVTTEYRQNLFNRKDDNILAIAPSVTVGIDSKVLDIELPVYFIHGRDDKGNLLKSLQGGVRFGYSTQTDEQWASFKDGLTAQLIVSEPLDVLNPFH